MSKELDFIPLVIRKSVYAASALPDTNASSLLAYSRLLNRSWYKRDQIIINYHINVKNRESY